METDAYIRFLLALVFVVALILVISWVVRRFGLAGARPMRRGKTRRLAIEETLTLDAKRRLVLIRRDDVEHLLILGPTGERVVETVPTDAETVAPRTPKLVPPPATAPPPAPAPAPAPASKPKPEPKSKPENAGPP